MQKRQFSKLIIFQNGVTDVFTNEADLSGISSDKLRMGALVQLVNFQVDEGLSDTNFLTSKKLLYSVLTLALQVFTTNKIYIKSWVF